MISALLHWTSAAFTLWVIAYLLPGIHIEGFAVAFIAAAVLGLVNMLIRPLVWLLTLPATLLTLGLFSFVINAAMFGLAAWFVPGFEVASFWSALFGSFLFAVTTSILGAGSEKNPKAA